MLATFHDRQTERFCAAKNTVQMEKKKGTAASAIAPARDETLDQS